jgi:hypothetical protein
MRCISAWEEGARSTLQVLGSFWSNVRSCRVDAFWNPIYPPASGVAYHGLQRCYSEKTMLPIKLVFLSVLSLTLISGAAATWLAMTAQTSQPTRRKVAERFAVIAFLGATAIFALLSRVEGD